MKKISIILEEKSINEALKELLQYKKWVTQKTDMLTQKLAEIGVKEASIRFARAIYDGVNDSHVSTEPTANGWKIIANGKAVCFIEFGSGVTHNTTEPYPMQRPTGIVGIGEYGNRYGKRKGWTYEGNPGSNGRILANGRVFTRGNPAAMPMWYAEQEIIREVSNIAKEVFSQ